MSRYSYRIADQINVTSGTGTISSSGTTITGVGTNFDPAVPVGTVIHVAGQNLVVATVTNDTSLTVVTAPTVAFSGASFTVTAMVNVEDLGANYQPPRSTFQPWRATVDLGNGTSRALGRPSATWSWGIISRAQRDTLRTYCTGKSVRVYIHTRKNDSSDAYATYDAVMLWPDDELKQAGRRFPFEIQFRDMIAL